MRFKNEDEFSKSGQATSPSGVYLLFGSEEYLVDVWRGRLTKPFSKGGAFNLQRLEGRTLSCDDLYNAVEALPLMSEKKCVVAEDIDISKLPAPELAKLEAIISDVPEDCVLILTGKAAFDPKSANGKKLLKWVDAAGVVAELGARGQAGLVSFLKNTAKRQGCELSTGLAQLILSTCENDMNSLRREVEKVCARAGYGPIGKEHIEAVVTPRTEARVFDLGRAIQAGRPKRALDILADLFELREEPIAILSTLIMSHMDQYRARIARDSGVSQARVVEMFGYKGREFRVRNAFGSRLSTAALREALEALYTCDRRMKSSGVDNKVLLEQTVIRLFQVAA